MREIKFSVLTIDNNWVVYTLQDLVMGDAIPHDDLQIKPETWSEYTGLKDKNGVEIYEGDIVKTIEHGLGQIKYIKQRGYAVVGSDIPCAVSAYGETVEIVGNIYENPELLESNNETSN